MTATSWTDIAVGQRWRSRDIRDNGLVRTVVEAPRGHAGSVVMTSGARTTRMRPKTLLTRYALIEKEGRR